MDTIHFNVVRCSLWRGIAGYGHVLAMGTIPTSNTKGQKWWIALFEDIVGCTKYDAVSASG